MVKALDTPLAREIIAELRERLPPKTFNHTLSVTLLTLAVGERTGLDERDLILAGLLHDSCKGLKPPELMARARRYGLDVTPVQQEIPALLHGPVAAAEWRARLGIEDGVYEAICWHTTGKPGLGPVGMALYFADFAEPFRTLPQAEVARRMFFETGYEEALDYVIDQKYAYIRTKKRMDPMTEAFHRWYHEARRHAPA